MKKIAILGSTGSIGTQTLEVVRANGDIGVVALTAGKNVDLLEKQIREFRPKFAAIWKEKDAKELKDIHCEIGFGMEGLIQAAVIVEADVVVTAVVGMIGIEPTVAAIEAGKDIALANKETLVCAGHIIMPLAEEKKVQILPVDSEHSAIFQCLQGNENNPIEKILLTASGGPFRDYTKSQLEKVTLQDALHHPNWSMGKKITIDSSTMVNKGLEVIEAKWLFSVEPENIQVVVQPQSIIHSMVQFQDGGVMAQLGTPDMKLPIQYALYYPNRRKLLGERLDFTRLSEITIARPDMEVFEGLKYAFEACKIGGSMPTVLNAANEYAVAKFLDGKIRYVDIVRMIRTAMDHHKLIQNPSVCDILRIQLETEKDLENGWI